jgi:hypothetical protein
MKKLNKLNINPVKLMKNEELMTLRGGWGMGKCVMPNNETCWEGRVDDCSQMGAECNKHPECAGWNYAICAGW